MSKENSEFTKTRINQHLIKRFVALTDENTEIEYCDHGSDIGILLITGDPNWGADMETPVIDSLFKHFDEQKISTMRFSFTKYQIFNNNYEKYITQAAVCLEEFLSSVEGFSKIWVIGYSFGSLVALNLALRRPDIFGVIMISPPILNYDFLTWFMAFKINVLVIYGTKDHLLPDNIIEAYCKFLTSNKVQVCMSPILGGDHYLTGKEQQINRECLAFIQNMKVNEIED